MIGNVYITGQIGNSYDENGNIITKGVELIDVINQIASNGDVDRTNVYINSQGGHVSVGKDIASLLGGMENVYTIADGLCASIATEIHLSVPLQNRTIIAGTEYIIHNPFMQNVTGDASQLEAYAKDIKTIETDMINMYSIATGVDKNAISGLMKIETGLTPEQCINLKFASQIIPKQQQRAVALIYTQKQTEMSKPMIERINNAVAVLTGKATVVATVEREAVAMVIKTDKGVLNTPYSDLMVGDPVTLEDGSQAKDDTYTDEDGTKIVVIGGLVSEIIESEDVAQATAEVDVLRASIEALKTELASVQAELSESKEVAEIAVAKIEELAKIGSTAVPPAQATVFRPKVEVTSTKSVKELMAEREDLYKNKK